MEVGELVLSRTSHFFVSWVWVSSAFFLSFQALRNIYSTTVDMMSTVGQTLSFFLYVSI
jgi:hypothetical protein